LSTHLEDPQDFLIALCKWQALGGEKPRLEHMEARWGDVLREATGQKIERVLARYFTTPPGERAMPFRLAMDLVESSRARADACAAALRDLQAELSLAGIPSLARKGVIYGALFYQDWAFRSQVDNDLFVRPQDREATFQYLKSKGYSPGNWSPVSMSVEPPARSALLLYGLNPDHLPHLSRSSSIPFCHVVRFDIALQIGWHGNPYPAIEEALAAAFDSEIHVAGIRTLGNRLHFLDCLLHTFREGFHENAIRDRIDVNLRKFLDVWLIWLHLNAADRQGVRDDLAAFDLQEAAGWVADHVDGLFNAGLADDLGIAGSYDRRFAQCWKSFSGETRSWSGTMRERLFAEDRFALFDGLTNEAGSLQPAQGGRPRRDPMAGSGRMS
jgi:hypothetical protein